MSVNFGKTFIVGFEGEELSPETAAKLQELDPAGVILFDTNLKDSEKVKNLTASLKTLLGKDLFVTVDQEGGKVQRLRNVSYELPSLMSIGLTSRKMTNENSFLFSREVLIHYAQALAFQLKDLGFNFVYGPCADLNLEKMNPIIGSRSLGEDYRIVSEQLKVIIEELKRNSIITCAKHFPGHGDSKKDSHVELPVVSRTLTSELINLKPFIAAIEADTDAIMMAHLILEIEQNSQLESIYIDESDISKEELKTLQILENPIKVAASINKELISKELIYLLGFKGLVVSDEITMKALTEYGNYTELSKKLLEAGNNLVIWNSNLDDALNSAQKLNSLPQEGHEELYKALEKSIEKIEQCKAKMSSSKLEYEYKEDYFVDLIKSSFETESKADFKKPDYVFVNFHPKLEMDKIEAVFNVPVKLLENGHENYDNQNILAILFQASIDELYILEQLKNNNRVFQVSTDTHDPGSHMNINGAGKLHYQALAKFLSR